MRRRSAERRSVAPDPKFNDPLVARFINYIMHHGKKGVAQGIVYDAISLIEKRTGNPGVEVFHKAVNNVAPLAEVRSRRVGGATYQVPIEVRADRRTALAFRWLIQFARNRSDRAMASRLANELLAASNGEGGSVKKKDDTHRMAESNKAFAHFRF